MALLIRGRASEDVAQRLRGRASEGGALHDGHLLRHQLRPAKLLRS